MPDEVVGTGRCTYCGGKVVPERDYREEKGWTRLRRQGGTNALRGRVETGKWACSSCVDKLGDKLSPHQGSLL
jgi:hypothetical protein